MDGYIQELSYLYHVLDRKTKYLFAICLLLVSCIINTKNTSIIELLVEFGQSESSELAYAGIVVHRSFYRLI